jgi:hypothetical protein
LSFNIWDSRAFGLLRKDLELQILSLYAGFLRILRTSKRRWISVVCYIRESGAFGLLLNDLGLQILSLDAGFPHILLTSN